MNDFSLFLVLTVVVATETILRSETAFNKLRLERCRVGYNFFIHRFKKLLGILDISLGQQSAHYFVLLSRLYVRCVMWMKSSFNQLEGHQLKWSFHFFFLCVKLSCLLRLDFFCVSFFASYLSLITINGHSSSWSSSAVFRDENKCRLAFFNWNSVIRFSIKFSL